MKIAFGILLISIWLGIDPGNRYQVLPQYPPRSTVTTHVPDACLPSTPVVSAVTGQSAPNKRKSSIITNGIEFVTIPAGRFMMGCSPGDSRCDKDEEPRHEVTITRSFELGKHEVTQGHWIKVMGTNPSSFKGDEHLPVECVSWNDARNFIAKLNALNDGYRYRLPTEAEWEYAARGGTTGAYYGSLDSIAWYNEIGGRKTHPVGQKQPNGHSLFDMSGNVWEWCEDWYDENYYAKSPAADPKGPSSGEYRVLRGGCWLNNPRHMRVSNRVRHAPGVFYYLFGFRLCRDEL